MDDASGVWGRLLSWWLFPPSLLHPRSLCLRHVITFMAFGFCMAVAKLVKESWEQRMG